MMAMAQRSTTIRDSTTISSATPAIEYTVYTFQCSEDTRGAVRWQRQDTLTDRAEALRMADRFYRSGEYCKVEVKQKQADPKTGQPVDTTLKTFERRAKKPAGSGAIAALAATGGFIAFALSYYLIRS